MRTGKAFSSNYIEYESNGDKDKTLSIEDCHDEIRPYLNNLIDSHRTQGEWKVQLTMAINFFSSKDSEDICTMHSTSDIIEILIGNETDEIIEKLFESFLKKYQEGLEQSMNRIKFVFDSVDLLHYKFHKISLNRGASYIDSPKWLQNRKATINPKNNDDKCLQYAVTVAINHQNIKNNLGRITKIKPFINQYDWKKKFPSNRKDRNEFEKNNETIALNILYVPYNIEEIRQAYKLKHNLKRKNKVIPFMITDGEKWHYLAVKRLSALLRGITSKREEDFYCLNCFHSYSTKDKLKKHKDVCENHDYCYIEMPKKNNKILKYNHGEKSVKIPLLINADIECLLERIDTFHNNPKKSSTTKIATHLASGIRFLHIVQLMQQKIGLIIIEAKTA